MINNFLKIYHWGTTNYVSLIQSYEHKLNVIHLFLTLGYLRERPLLNVIL